MATTPSDKPPGPSLNELTVALRAQLSAFGVRAVCVGFSGGVDSSVLLHAAAALRPDISVSAVHVNHGLQEQAAGWESHCRRICGDLALPLTCRRVAVVPGPNLEARARDGRYAAFAEVLSADQWLLLAHHADDQAETVLLRLLRGGGSRGLAGIPVTRPVGESRLLRPLLDWSRDDLLSIARAEEMDWVEDPSNRTQEADRNWLRQAIMPRLRQRRPGLRKLLQGVARQANQERQCLDALAEMDVADLRLAGPLPALNLGALAELDEARRDNALRYWLGQQGLVTGSGLLDALWQGFCAPPDRQPHVDFGDRVLRRLGRAVVLMPVPGAVPSSGLVWSDPSAALDLGSAGQLSIAGLPRQDIGPLEVRFRHGGERCRPAGKPLRRPLKKWLNEAAVPPFVRPYLPLIYREGTLVAVADLFICEELRANGPGDIEIHWQAPDALRWRDWV